MTLAGSPIHRSAAPLRTQVVDRLRTAIVTGEYTPGKRLLERDLCSEFGVSRTVVRESLRQLESERLVDIVPSIGPFVHVLTRQEAAGLYDVRASLEALAGRSAAQNASSEQVDRLRSIVAELAADDGRLLGATLELKNEFYRVLVDASGNPTIGELFGNVQARISELRSVSLSHPGRATAMCSELTAIVDAIARGDAEAAADGCQRHVEVAARLALQNLPQSDLPQSARSTDTR